MKNVLEIRNVIEEIKSIIKDRIKFEFGIIREDSHFLRIEAKIFFEDKKIETIMLVDNGSNYYLIGSQDTFNYKDIEKLELAFKGIFSRLPGVELQKELMTKINSIYLPISDSILELETENFKLSKQYKMRCLYDDSFKVKLE